MRKPVLPNSIGGKMVVATAQRADGQLQWSHCDKSKRGDHAAMRAVEGKRQAKHPTPKSSPRVAQSQFPKSIYTVGKSL